VGFLKSLFAGLVILAVALLARPLLIRALQINAHGGAVPSGSAGRSAAPREASPRALAGPDPRTSATARAGQPAKEPEDLLDAVIDVRRIEGRINAASARRLAELLDRHPDLAAQAMRRWLAQGSDSR
jgi:flagellar M-ring protein FliF